MIDQPAGDTPVLTNSTCAANYYTSDGLDYTTTTTPSWVTTTAIPATLGEEIKNLQEDHYRRVSQIYGSPVSFFDPGPAKPKKKELNEPMSNRRIVQVFIADIDPNVPLDKAVIYSGDRKLTDLTDPELFFEIAITELLKKHNEERVKWLDKEATRKAGRDMFLEPVRIKDLRMVVVDIAKF